MEKFLLKSKKIPTVFRIFRMFSGFRIATSDRQRKDNRGAAALLTIVIIGIASLIMAISAARLGLGELEMGYDEGKGSAVLSLADGCGEEALARLRKNSAYTGETITTDDGSCVIIVTGGGADRTVASVATIGSYTKKIEMQVTLSDSVISIISWGETSP